MNSRRLFNLMAAVSLLLCVATAALWARSESVYDELRVMRWNESARVFSIPQCFTNPGRLIVARTTCSALPGDDVSVARKTGGQWTFNSPRKAFETTPMFLPLTWDHGDRAGGFAFVELHGSGTEWRIVVQLWLLVLLFAIQPTAWTWSLLRRRLRRGSGQVPTAASLLRQTFPNLTRVAT